MLFYCREHLWITGARHCRSFLVVFLCCAREKFSRARNKVEHTCSSSDHDHPKSLDAKIAPSKDLDGHGQKGCMYLKLACKGTFCHFLSLNVADGFDSRHIKIRYVRLSWLTNEDARIPCITYLGLFQVQQSSIPYARYSSFFFCEWSHSHIHTLR